MATTLKKPTVGTAIASSATSSTLTRAIPSGSVAKAVPALVGGKASLGTTVKESVVSGSTATTTSEAVTSGSGTTTAGTTVSTTPATENPFYKKGWFIAIAVAAVLAGAYFLLFKKAA